MAKCWYLVPELVAASITVGVDIRRPVNRLAGKSLTTNLRRRVCADYSGVTHQKIKLCIGITIIVDVTDSRLLIGIGSAANT